MRETRIQAVAVRDASAPRPAARNPFVFIVGCPRSGTTLLRRMVDAHPELAITKRESHWIPKVFRRGIGLTRDGVVTEALISWLVLDERFQFMGIERADLDAVLRSDGRVTYAHFVSRIFDLYAERAGKPLAGDKTPGYARHVPLLHALWPGARFVHLIRDGRDVYLSMRDWAKSPRILGRSWPWAEHPAASAALFWEQHVRLAREAGSDLGPTLYYEVRYETLVSSPAETCRGLCEFLGLPDSERMLLTGEGRRNIRPGIDVKHARLPPTAGLRDWCSQMPVHDVERFEAAAGDLLDELGYPRGAAEPSRAARNDVLRVQQGRSRK